MNNSSNSDFRTVRGYQLASQQDGQLLTPALEDYLEMAYRLYLEHHYLRVGQLSELLNVKPSSASKMISKLAALGYLKYDRYEVILLTEQGQTMGEYLLERHRTIETFLTVLGSSNALEETELIEHTLSPSTVLDIDLLNRFFQENPKVQKQFTDYQKAYRTDPNEHQ
ncbi:MAG: iron dependent repressor, metal binding and dimerization domain protein [Clostridium sp.]|uniref:metal-dependent transcriptional regulator n=1 Tax=Clostridium sp. TaxID=1506 RepID=UPI00290781F2|nr:iron dependent repressor, metal binding and dimerization domain protein [Clostridium sp.]MDU7337876.1 iron dependent repressor, metal binding and dimerization domain protein [Clostridium sp.]